MKKHNKYKLGVLAALLGCTYAYAEPSISIIHGPKPKTSIIVVEHDDGWIDKLLIKDEDLDKDSVYLKWFSGVMKEARKRK